MKRELIIENKAIKRQREESLTYNNIIMLTVVAIFLPYIIAGIVLVGLGIYLTLNQQTRKIILSHKNSKYTIMFFVFYLLEALVYKNWFGTAAGLGLILAIMIGYFQRSFMTEEFYERVLTLVCILSITSSTCAITQKFIISAVDDYYRYNRISAMFLHPNYFGTITAIVIIICAYKILTNQGPRWLYCFIGCLNVVSIYLSESMFAWVEVFVGIGVLLFVLKRYRLLLAWTSIGAIAAYLILFLNVGLIPRLSDAKKTLSMRFEIWNFAIEQIRKYPLFGHGSMSCAFLSYKEGHLIPHSHSILLDNLMNYGFIGTTIMALYFIRYYTRVISLIWKEKKTRVLSLILAVSAAAMVHGLTDVTLFWIQTLPLFIFILSGCGTSEIASIRIKVPELTRRKCVYALKNNYTTVYYTKK